MKMKKFFSGFLAAIMSITTIAMPLSTAIAEDDPPVVETGKIIINHAATTGTYKAYPIFVGDVEQEEDDEGKLTGRLVIDTPEFHPNLETTIGYMEGDVIARVTENPKNNENYYGLYLYLNNSGKTIGGKSFEQLMKEYDSNATGISSLNSEAKTASSNKDAAEAIANLLNLTCKNSPTSNVNIITGADKKGAAFYSAFAEAARMFMVDNIVQYDTESGKNVSNPGELKDVVTGGAAKKVGDKNVVEIEITRPGYYLVEYTPDGTDTLYDTQPKMVRRSLVLVGLGDDCKATINSKDTTNVASVDIQFNETLLVKNETKDGEGNVIDTSYTYNGTEGTWTKNVSAGNGDYVSCRVVVTLPGNLAAYDQYYLAVPIMYGYNNVTTSFDGKTKSITRVESDDKDSLKYMKAYFIEEVEEIGEDGSKKTVEKKTLIIKDPDANYSEDNLTDSASEIFNNDHNAELTIDKSYTYADETKNSSAADADDFKAHEAFVISDIANMIVRAKDEENKDAAIFKSNYANPQNGDGWNKFVIEFPVKFERFDTLKLNESATSGVSVLGYFNGTYGDDLLMKNYISAKLVYSNNPNLEVPRNEEDGTILSDEEKAKLTGSDMLYLDTSKAPGTLYNPVSATKKGGCVSANIVTYRLRVHATTEDLFKLAQGGGLEGIRFAIKRQDGCYAVVEEFASAYQTYDEVDGENIREKDGSYPNSSSFGSVYVYKIVGWVDPDEEGKAWAKDEKGNYDVPTTSTMYTYNTKTHDGGIYRINNTARFEIVGIAPGDYTIVALDEAIKANDYYASSVDADKAKEYKLRKENGQNYLKTEYRFSFAPTLSESCTKLLYNTHYAPVGVADSVITDDQVLITEYNLKWYDMEGKELTGGKGEAEKPDWWLGQREDVGLMSMRVTYIKKGITLPVTGGIGTFIFFAVGGALVVISTVAIVTKFRIKREQL